MIFVWKIKSASLLVSTDYLVKINTSLKILYKLRYSSLLLLEILMLDIQNAPIMILPMQMAVHLILSHHQQDINKLSKNLLKL